MSLRSSCHRRWQSISGGAAEIHVIHSEQQITSYRPGSTTGYFSPARSFYARSCVHWLSKAIFVYSQLREGYLLLYPLSLFRHYEVRHEDQCTSALTPQLMLTPVQNDLYSEWRMYYLDYNGLKRELKVRVYKSRFLQG